MSALRRSLAEHVAALVRRDQEFADLATEVGLVDRDWLDDPVPGPMSSATPVEVLERFLARSVEQRPSVLASLGLNALQLMTFDREGDEGGAPQVLTVMFTDLEGFTPFTAEHGDAAASEVLAQHYRAVGPVVRARGGKVVKHLGDGLLVTFPEAAAAVYAGVELLDTAPAPLRLRAGAHTGEVVVTRDDVVGHVVNVAARVTEVTDGGQVVVTQAVQDAAGPLRGLAYGESRRATLKGVPEAVTVLAVQPQAPPALGS